jgi:peptidylprolyl isomerase
MHDLVCGDGVPAGTGDLVEIELSGSLDTGRRLRGARSFRFTIGSGQVIAGLEQGVAGMRVGGRRVLVVPPELAFGRGGLRGEVPGGATLELMVQLLDLVEAEA